MSASPEMTARMNALSSAADSYSATDCTTATPRPRRVSNTGRPASAACLTILPGLVFRSVSGTTSSENLVSTYISRIRNGPDNSTCYQVLFCTHRHSCPWRHRDYSDSSKNGCAATGGCGRFPVGLRTLISSNRRSGTDSVTVVPPEAGVIPTIITRPLEKPTSRYGYRSCSTPMPRRSP